MAESFARCSDIIVKYNLIVCSDEAHCDLLIDKNVEHIPISSLNSDIERQCITLMSPGKAFNIAGLSCAFAIIADPKIRNEFKIEADKSLPKVNTLGYTATLSAYSKGESWLKNQIQYIRKNHDYLLNQINSIPGLSMGPVQASYLAWINTSGLNLKNPQLFFEQSGVGLSSGVDFGDKNHVRMNFACPHEMLVEAVQRIKNSIQLIK